MEKNEKYSSIKHKVKFLTTVLSWTLFVLLIFVAIILVYYFITTKIYAKKDANYRPAFGLYTIISPSMEKTLNIYDVIVNVKIKSPDDIKIGDIITFISSSTSSKGMTITHRVISIKEDENGNKVFQTKGDNNTSPDPKPATFDNIIGKVIFKIPQLGRLQSILTTKGGWLIIVVIPAFIIILSDILKLIRLQTAQKSIEEINNNEEKQKQKEIEKKKNIEENLIKKYKKPNRSEYESDPLKKSSVILNVENSYKEDYQEEPEIPIDNSKELEIDQAITMSKLNDLESTTNNETETNLPESTNFEESSNNQPKESLPIIPPFELPKKKIRSRKKKKKHKN